MAAPARIRWAESGHASAVRRETTIAPTTPLLVVSGAAIVCLRP